MGKRLLEDGIAVRGGGMKHHICTPFVRPEIYLRNKMQRHPEQWQCRVFIREGGSMGHVGRVPGDCPLGACFCIFA